MSALAHKWGDLWSRWRGAVPAEGPDALPVRVHGTEFTRTRAAPVRVKGFDQPLIWVTVTLLLWGLVMVYSASIAMPDNPRFGNYAQTHFLLRHVAAIGVGLVAASLAYQVPMDTWDKWAPWLFIASLVLLIVVLIPGIGWRALDPTHNSQPGETYVKIAVGRDYADVAPISGHYVGSTERSLEVSVRVTAL